MSNFVKQLYVFIFLLMFGVPGVLCAENSEVKRALRADEVKVVTPDYQPEFSEFDPPLGTYTFRVSWQGIPAATLEVRVGQEGLNYNVLATAKTYRGIDLFYRLRYRVESLISAVDLTPIRTVIDHRENSREKATDLIFHDDGSIESVRYRKGKELEVLQFTPGNVTLDPISAAFLARSLHWEVGEKKYFDVFNGKSRYIITLEAKEKELLKVNDREREAIIIVPKVENPTNPKQAEKLRSAKIYLSTDPSKEILQIVSSVFIGSVKTKLVEFSPATEPPISTIAALKEQRSLAIARK
ncbi:MAG: DUF3108 domain-containing protein [Bdellovibrionales bacterium]|nr:DUF3108 domain-containing protein [Bdellovibrionales bacterium]